MAFIYQIAKSQDLCLSNICIALESNYSLRFTILVILALCTRIKEWKNSVCTGNEERWRMREIGIEMYWKARITSIVKQI
uniref:Uncharacterized protein n=1 Tax=Arundo donax TaxID=35708 RepID=A0A0A9HG80_ARUDO